MFGPEGPKLKFWDYRREENHRKNIFWNKKPLKKYIWLNYLQDFLHKNRKISRNPFLSNKNNSCENAIFSGKNKICYLFFLLEIPAEIGERGVHMTRIKIQSWRSFYLTPKSSIRGKTCFILPKQKHSSIGGKQWLKQVWFRTRTKNVYAQNQQPRLRCTRFAVVHTVCREGREASP